MKKITVIMPVYNGEKYIRRSIKSVLNQSYKNFEFIIIDDGSQDETVSIIREYMKEDYRIILIQQENKGVSEARNYGISMASGDYITFIDADDSYEVDTLNILYEEIENSKNDICAGRFRVIDNNISLNDQEYPIQVSYVDSEEFIREIFLGSFIRGFLWNKIFKKTIFSTIQFQPELDICEDLYFISQIALNIQRVAITNQIIYNYYLNSDSVTHNYNKLIDKSGNWKYVQVYQDIYNLFENKPRCQEIILIATLNIARQGMMEIIDKKEYRNIYKKLKKLLLQNLIFIMKNSDINIKEKIKFSIIFCFPRSILNVIKEKLQ